jgi:hypothetical protein
VIETAFRMLFVLVTGAEIAALIMLVAPILDALLHRPRRLKP